MAPWVSHIKYRNLYAGSAKCDAGGIEIYIYKQKNRASRTTRLARSRSPINVLPEAICCCLQICYVGVMLLLMECMCVSSFIVVTAVVV